MNKEIIEQKFKVGDKVLCADDTAIGFNPKPIKKGKVYTVEEVNKLDGFLKINGIFWWSSNRFKIAQPRQLELF